MSFTNIFNYAFTGTDNAAESNIMQIFQQQKHYFQIQHKADTFAQTYFQFKYYPPI